MPAGRGKRALREWPGRRSNGRGGKGRERAQWEHGVSSTARHCPPLHAAGLRNQPLLSRGTRGAPGAGPRPPPPPAAAGARGQVGRGERAIRVAWAGPTSVCSAYSGPPRCGEKHRGATPGPRPPAVGVAPRGKERGGGGGAPRRRKCPGRVGIRVGARWRRPGVVSGGWRGGERISIPPFPVVQVPHSQPSPRQPGGFGLGRFGDLRSWGGVHRRAAGRQQRLMP